MNHCLPHEGALWPAPAADRMEGGQGIDAHQRRRKERVSTFSSETEVGFKARAVWCYYLSRWVPAKLDLVPHQEFCSFRVPPPALHSEPQAERYCCGWRRSFLIVLSFHQLNALICNVVAHAVSWWWRNAQDLESGTFSTTKLLAPVNPIH